MKRGFTLIELLVVVLIIGILSAVALPQYTTAVEKSRVSEALINLKHAQQARIMEYLAVGSTESSPAKDIMELSGGFWNADGWGYCTKNFFYTFDDSTYVSVKRCDSKSDCSGCQSSTQYEISRLTPYDSEGWENGNSCTAYTDVGYKICKSLEGQGFTPYDER